MAFSPAPEMPRGTRGYAVCAVARSGSTWFMALLAGTEVLGRPCEAFNLPLQREIVGPGYPAQRSAQARFVLDRCATPNGVYGVKMTPALLARLGRNFRWTETLPNLRFIHWHRRDLLGQALSRHRAIQTQQWYSTSRAGDPASYDGDAILFEVRRGALMNAHWEAYFARTGIAPLRLVYEDALADPQKAVEAVAAFLGLDERPVADSAKIKLERQRDAMTEAWRARFLDEYGDPDVMDEL